MNLVTLAVWQYLRNISSRITTRQIECPPDTEASNEKSTESVPEELTDWHELVERVDDFFPSTRKNLI